MYWVQGGGRVLPREWYTTCFATVQFFTLDGSKIEVSEACFFDIVNTHNDHASYVKHVLGSVYFFFALFGYWVWGVSPKELGHKKPLDNFCSGQLKIESL